MGKEKILKEIFMPRMQPKCFSEIIKAFDEKIESSKTICSPIKLKNYFGYGLGKKTIFSKLIADGLIENDWKNNKTGDFKGLYIFFADAKPFYIGITKNVIQRTLQHLKGTNHNQATLAYNLGLLNYKSINGSEYSGKRKKFDFKKYVKPMQDFLMDQNIGFIHVENDDELYIFEIYCSMKFETVLNKFETH